MGEMILPCPFCGNTPPGVTEILAGKVWAIDCKNILHSAGAMSWVSADDVIAQWNRRDTAQHERIVAGLEARLNAAYWVATAASLLSTHVHGHFAYPTDNSVAICKDMADKTKTAIDAFLAQTAEWSNNTEQESPL